MLSNSPVIKVGESTFEAEVIQSEIPVLIDLYADWCAPCRTLSPRVEQVAREYAGRVKVVKINVDEAPKIAQAFRAQSIPMLVLIVDGRPTGVLKGVVTKEEIIALIDQHVRSTGPGGVENVKPLELAKLLKAKQVLVVDLREKAPYNRAHVPGAINILPADIEASLPELARHRKPVIVYDRNFSDEAKKVLEVFAQTGFPAAGLEGGILAWEGDGLEIERSN